MKAVSLVPIMLLLMVGRSSSAAEWEPTWGVRLSSPQWISASGGILIGQIERPADADPKKTHLPHGLLLQIEPGLGGGKLSVGYATGLLPYAAGGVKASLLRTWGKPLFADPNCTYVGLEAEASFFIKFGVGVMARVAGAEDSPKILVTGGIGLAF